MGYAAQWGLLPARTLRPHPNPFTRRPGDNVRKFQKLGPPLQSFQLYIYLIL